MSAGRKLPYIVMQGGDNNMPKGWDAKQAIEDALRDENSRGSVVLGKSGTDGSLTPSWQPAHLAWFAI